MAHGEGALSGDVAVGLAALRAQRADVLHLQWLVPEVDGRLFRPHAPSVFTAHDLVPRRTAGRHRLWRRLFDRFDRVVVHSERGRDVLAGFGVDAAAAACLLQQGA